MRLRVSWGPTCHHKQLPIPCARGSSCGTIRVPFGACSLSGPTPVVLKNITRQPKKESSTTGFRNPGSYYGKTRFGKTNRNPKRKKTGESGAWLDKFGQSERQTYVWYPLGWSRSLRKSSDPVLAVLKPWDWENPSGNFTKRYYTCGRYNMGWLYQL